MSSTIKNTSNFIVTILVLLMSSPIGAQQQDDVALYAQAEQAYLKNDCATAEKLYQRMAEKTPSVYYNMGNCAYKMDKFGYALLYWRRAELDWGLFNRSMLLKNIELVKQKMSIVSQKDLSDQAYPKVILIFLTSAGAVFFSIVRAIPLFHLQVIVLGLWIILFLCLRYFGKKKHTLLISLLFGFLALSASMLGLKYSLAHQKRLVVIRKDTPLLSGAGKNFAIMGHLPEAQEADILKESENFYRIRINKHIGWIDKQFAEKI